MKNTMWSWKSARTIALILLAMVIGSAPAAIAFDSNPALFPPDGAVSGMTYGDWSAAWWQYIVSIPASTNPLNDVTGCGPEQSSGSILFLAGSFVGPVTRRCSVPAGKAILLPIINVECSTLEAPPFHGNNEAELRSCAATFGDAIGVKTLAASIDGMKVKDLGSFRAQSPVFGFTLAKENVLGAKPGTGFSASDGYWLMLKPLSPGQHMIHFEGACVPGSPCDGFSQNVNYNLTVTE